jgi:hypothetical protein
LPALRSWLFLSWALAPGVVFLDPISQSYMPDTRFEDASQRLLSVVKEQIRAGAMSERRLAKLAGVSQPHMHNVLAGKRGLEQGLADRVLEVFGLSLEDLLLEGGRQPQLSLAAFEAPLGGGRAFPRTVSVSFGFERARATGLEVPCLARVAAEETSMRPMLQPGDDILLETSWSARSRLRDDAIYAIEWRGLGYLCRCRMSNRAILTLIESHTATPPPARIPLGKRGVADVVRGEVVWFGRLLPGAGGV